MSFGKIKVLIQILRGLERAGELIKEAASDGKLTAAELGTVALHCFLPVLEEMEVPLPEVTFDQKDGDASLEQIGRAHV